MASKNKTGIEKLEEYSYGMKQRRYDDLLDLFEQIELEHVSELQALEKRYKTDLREAREARDIAIKEASKLRNDVNLAKDLVHDFRSDIAIMLGISCDGMADDVQESIDSELDKRLMPHGMEWPRFDDGEKITWNNSPDHTAAICLALDGSCYALHYDMPEDERMCIYEVSDRVKRPVTEVLGADGVPLKVGETVYGTGREQDVYKVTSMDKSKEQGRFAVECISNGGETCMVDPSQLTHTPPDTQKSIDDDATLHPGVYCVDILHVESSEVGDYSECTEAMALDLLRRQRDLCAKGGE